MTRTSWSHCSRLALALVVLLAAATVPAAAVSVGDEDVPAEGQVGTQVTATVTLTELYRSPQLEEWQLAGQTELTDVTWTVSYIDQTGAKVGQQSFDGQSFDGAEIATANGTAEVEVQIRGTVPEVEEYTYDPRQTFTLIHLRQTREGGSTDEIDRWEAAYFTEESAAAREALDGARGAIQSASSAGANTDEAEQSFANAVDAYESGEFELATNLAEEAESRAESARQSNRTFQYALYAAGGLVVVAVVVGAFFLWRSRRDSYDKLG